MPARTAEFQSEVEPPEPMKGLVVPPELVGSLGGGKRPRVTVTINGHSWTTRIAIMRGRNLIGLSHANRRAAGIATGDLVEVALELVTEAPRVVEPPDLAAVLDADPIARAAYDGLTYSHRRAVVHAIETAKRPETRQRRIQNSVEDLHRQ
jgi:Bacteriocin-protection, YdeI or OmpD-Associated/Domain of unknown function (DUF1905)